MPPKKRKNPWKKITSRKVYENPWIKVEEHQVLNPGGKNGIYGKVYFKNTAIGIVVLDDELNTWLVGQHRYPLDAWSWEIPEGGGKKNQSALASAKRELREETGIRASRWKPIVRTHLSNSVSDEAGIIFLAQGLTFAARAPEASEADMQVWKLPFRTALKMVTAGKITDALSVMGILTTARLLKL